MKDIIYNLLHEAGDIVLKYYGNSSINYKSDKSPVTDADIECSQFLVNALNKIFPNIPVVSEEMEDIENIRMQNHKYFLIDPLDGTKEFINNQDEFCIIIALLEHNKPIMGAIYAPKLNIYAYVDTENFEFTGIKHSSFMPDVGLTSVYHHNQSVDSFYNEYGFETLKVGSAIKFIKLALGHAKIYLRLEGSKEWDTAAGQLFVERQGFRVIDLKTMNEMVYGKKSVKNNPFLVIHNSLDINKFNLAKYLNK